MSPFAPVRVILRRRSGQRHPPGEIEELVGRFVRGEVADYQMTAWMMATYFRPLSRQETARLTRAMIASGQPLPPWPDGPPVVDKHSTGGVGDKVSLVVAPLAASCGLRVPMISGRSLGHTGGTLDKLESIPGYRVRLEPAEFRSIVSRVGCSIAGTTDAIAPADRRMYALRDVAGIIESPPLIVASILSKKASARLEGLVFDVKVGRGGFMTSRREARGLARMLVAAAGDLGIRSEALLTRMDEPLGEMIGNALEVNESIRLLRGEAASPALKSICLETASAMLRVGGGGGSAAEIRRKLDRAWESGAALERLARMIEAHGGDPRVTEDPARLPAAQAVREVLASGRGWIQRIDARLLGETVVDLGGGRHRVEDAVDPRVGIAVKVRRGELVERGSPLAAVHLADGGQWGAELDRRIRESIPLASRRPGPRAPLLLERLRGPGKRSRAPEAAG
jgi:pyrimidine-nucleoside phosphorylase